MSKGTKTKAVWTAIAVLTTAYLGFNPAIIYSLAGMSPAGSAETSAQ